MPETVSESVTGQNEPKPTREERDDAFSTGAGRKAEEVSMPTNLKKHGAPSEKDETLEAPVGLDNETKAKSCGS